jgi:hypothetical protein
MAASALSVGSLWLKMSASGQNKRETELRRWR